MVSSYTPKERRTWRDAFGPGFVSGPSDKTLKAVAAAQKSYRPIR